MSFEVDGDSVRLRKTPNRGTRGDLLVRRLLGSATVDMTTDEILELTRATHQSASERPQPPRP